VAEQRAEQLLHRVVAEEGRKRAAASAAAAAEIGGLTDREILIAGAVAYWCEGAKNKPHRRADRVIFTNSDPELISFFLLFLDTAGVPRSNLAFQLQIHETADVKSAERFWLTLTEARPEQFRPTSLKRPNPMTTRKNTGDDYHGCLRVDVKQSCELYRKIEGWASAAATSAEAPNDHVQGIAPLPGKDSNLRWADQNRQSCL
jgi:hypothetical protein